MTMISIAVGVGVRVRNKAELDTMMTMPFQDASKRIDVHETIQGVVRKPFDLLEKFGTETEIALHQDQRGPLMTLMTIKESVTADNTTTTTVMKEGRAHQMSWMSNTLTHQNAEAGSGNKKQLYLRDTLPELFETLECWSVDLVTDSGLKQLNFLRH